MDNINFLPGNNHFNSSNKDRITVNNCGYRAPSFEKINWQDSIVIFGCSVVFGTGLEEKDTISSHLSRLLNVDVINLGVPGSSIFHSTNNQLALREKNILPRVVINLWTSIYRHTYFFKKQPANLGPWTEDLKLGKNMTHFYSIWCAEEQNVKSNALFHYRSASTFWDQTKHIQATFFEDTSKLFNIPYCSIDDFADDGYHPGPATAAKTAQYLASLINKS